MLIRTTCDKCKEEDEVAFYFYDVRVLTEHIFGTVDGVEYTASALGRSVCPYCGEEIRRQFTSTLFRRDIIELAIRKEIKKRMNEKKQIEEMTKLLWHFPKTLCLNCYNDCEEAAKLLYEEDYRKQKWISVDERLPEDEQIVLTIDTEGEMQVCFYETAWEGIFQQCHGLVKIYNIAHWMPLPEAPKKKGGE